MFTKILSLFQKKQEAASSETFPLAATMSALEWGELYRKDPEEYQKQLQEYIAFQRQKHSIPHVPKIRS